MLAILEGSGIVQASGFPSQCGSSHVTKDVEGANIINSTSNSNILVCQCTSQCKLSPLLISIYRSIQACRKH